MLQGEESRIPLNNWDRGISKLVPFPSTIVEARGTALQVTVRNIETLEEFAFQAHNGKGKPASWSVMVQAYMPERMWLDNQYLPPESEVAVTSREQLDETTTASPESEVVVTSPEEQDEVTTDTAKIEMPIYTCK